MNFYYSPVNSAEDKLIFFLSFFFFKKIGFYISCKFSRKKTMHEMSILFSGKNMKKISKCGQLKFSPSMLSIK